MFDMSCLAPRPTGNTAENLLLARARADKLNSSRILFDLLKE